MELTQPIFNIQPVTKDDLPEVMRINKGCLPENYPTHYFMYLFTSYPSSFLIAKIGEEIVGYIMCKIQPNRFTNKIPFLKRGPIGHIVSVAVMKDHRNKKIGEKLVIHGLLATTISYQTKEYMLEVRVSNRAVDFYKRLGFAIERVLKGYYNDGEDGYLMIRGPFENSDK